MSKEKKEPERFHLYVTHKELGELLIIEHDGKIRMKGKEVPMAELVRFLMTYEP